MVAEEGFEQSDLRVIASYRSPSLNHILRLDAALTLALHLIGFGRHRTNTNEHRPSVS